MRTVTVADLIGSAPDLTGGLSPVEYIRSLRDEPVEAGELDDVAVECAAARAEIRGRFDDAKRRAGSWDLDATNPGIGFRGLSARVVGRG